MGGVFAHDCNLVVWSGLDNTVKGYATIYTKYHTFMPVSGFNQALINLKAYCCSQVIQKACEKKEKDNLPKYYPESAYLFDHLLDVTMRRFDAIPSLAYGLEVDPIAKEWRDKITEIANTTVGKQASEIQKIYTGYRTLHTDFAKNIESSIDGYGKDNLAAFSLADRYNSICLMLKTMYGDIQTTKWFVTDIGWYTYKNSFFSKCLNIVKDRVSRENWYVKILMIQKSNQLLDETTKAYTKKHFVEEKLMGLWSIVSKVKDMFQTIVQQAPVSKTCSK